MHDCIRDWTRKWDPSLMTSTVWPVWPSRWHGISHVWCELGAGRLEVVMVGDWNGWQVGCVEGGSFGLSFETDWYWGNLMSFYWAVTGCVLGSVHGGFLEQSWDGPNLGHLVCFLIGKCQTGPGLVIWTGPRSEITNGCEPGHPMEVS